LQHGGLLGRGYQSTYTLEQGMNADTGSQADGTRLFDRQAWVGVATHLRRAVALGWPAKVGGSVRAGHRLAPELIRRKGRVFPDGPRAGSVQVTM
jgi:hypothetical protein